MEIAIGMKGTVSTMVEREDTALRLAPAVCLSILLLV